MPLLRRANPNESESLEEGHKQALGEFVLAGAIEKGRQLVPLQDFFSRQGAAPRLCIGRT
jgi:hypothetical protein